MLNLPTPRILTVTELTRSIRGILETEFPFVTVSGEISNLRQPYSGHIYFTLKDEDSQLRAVLFKPQQKYLRELPVDNQQVICRGRISVYEPRGEYQLIIDYVERLGTGELQIAFENLKLKLAEEGLFDQEHKKEIPEFPSRVALVTSPEGAALYDFLKVSLNRFPSQAIEIFPVRVQGKEAAPEICEAITTLNQRKRSDVIVLCRGGGSIEDLWPFNEESVARAIYESSIPVVSAIGHEIDFTIADFVADQRAPTPSAAAEEVVPNRQILAEHVQRLRHILAKTVLQQIGEKRHQVAYQQSLVGDPRSLISHNFMYLDNVYSSLVHGYKSFLYRYNMKLESLTGRLHNLSPAQQLVYKKQWSRELTRRLQSLMVQHLEKKRNRLTAATTLLDAVSPLGILGRGFAVVRSGPSEKPPGELIRTTKQVKLGKDLEVILQEGKLGCEVTEIKEDGRDERIISQQND
ncbi:MAG: exodeoxyribonuclease VII large subunit [Deltaproteobacteria bacterium]|nr:MAG: exodeoxyribonuclease VII large subunit [Deltaproteobacteria bacterium]